MLKYWKRILVLLVTATALGLAWGGVTLAKRPGGGGDGKGGGKLPLVGNSSGAIYYWDQGYPDRELPDRELVVKMNWNGTDAIPLDNSGVNNAINRYSWDVSHGSSSRFFIYETEDSGLYVDTEAGGSELKISTFSASNPALSQDDAKVAFSARLDGQLKLCVADLVYDSDDPLDPPTGVGEPVAVVDIDRSKIATWSPDARYIAYGNWANSFGDVNDIFVVGVYDAAGNLIDNPQPVNVTNKPSVHHSKPAWSPCSSRIAFQGVNRGRSNGSIYIVSPDGSNLVLAVGKANSGAPWNQLPAWSPDGQQVAFGAMDGKRAEAVMRSAADGSTSAANLTGFSRERIVCRVHWRP